MSIRAPREHFSEIIARVGTDLRWSVRLILTMVPDGARARFDSQIVTAIVASSTTACSSDLGASSGLSNMIL